MKIKIWMLNLGDADCTLIVLLKDNKKFFIVIDCGKPKHTSLIKHEINLVMKSENLEQINLLVLTHFDSDHVGGMKEVINYFQKNIKQLWIHGVSEAINAKKKVFEESSIFPTESNIFIGGRANNNFESANEILIKTLEQEQEVIAKANDLNIPMNRPIKNLNPIFDFPEIQILGPTESYLKYLFPKIGSIENLFSIENLSYDNLSEKKYENAFEALDAIKKSNVTPINLASVIIMITIQDKKFVFCGDAGIKSFQNIHDYKNVLKNLYWLKVPHHGSINNINTELIKLFSPSFAYVSGKKYFSEVVGNCFEQIGSQVEVTSLCNKNLFFEYSI